jgi:two-component system, OmpR family, heavy metal sensor histidine kinase CusS
MSFASLKTATHSLRFRLMVWNAAVVLLTAIGILLGVREGLRFSLLSEMDQVLRQDIIEIGLSVREYRLANLSEIHEDMNRKAQGHDQDGWFVQFLDARGNEIFTSQNTPEPHPDRKLFLNSEAISAAGQRMRQDSLATLDGQTIRVRVGASLDFLARDMQRIDQLAMMIVAAMLVIAPLGGYWLAGRATRPLAEIIQTMAQLRPTQLDERLKLRHTGDELDQLSLTFNKLLDRIGEYLQQNRDSLANAAHELRTPLAALRSSIEVCLHEERPPEEYRELLVNLIDEGTALETLVNQLLLLAETETSRLKSVGQYVELQSLVVRCVDMFRGVAEFRQIELIATQLQETYVEGNRHHLRQLLNNLLDNALKFTPPGGRVTLSLTHDEAQRKAILRVADTGFGIAPQEVPHLFERFYRGDHSRRRDQDTRGTGLGLCICQSVVQSHGGSIEVSSAPGQGTTFTAELPLLGPELLAAARLQQRPEASLSNER